MRTIMLLLFVAAALLLPRRANACSCIGSGPACEAFWVHDAVFVGEVIDIERSSEPPDAMHQRRVLLSVSESFRGVTSPTVEVLTGIGGGDCGYSFDRGRSYIVYAYRLANGQLGTGICSRTAPLAKAADDLSYARHIPDGYLGATVFGTVFNEDVNISTKPNAVQYGPVPNIGLSFDCDGAIFRTTTDSNGKFEVSGVPAVTCRATVERATQPRGAQAVTIRDARGCAAVDLIVSMKPAR